MRSQDSSGLRKTAGSLLGQALRAPDLEGDTTSRTDIDSIRDMLTTASLPIPSHQCLASRPSPIAAERVYLVVELAARVSLQDFFSRVRPWTTSLLARFSLCL